MNLLAVEPSGPSVKLFALPGQRYVLMCRECDWTETVVTHGWDGMRVKAMGREHLYEKHCSTPSPNISQNSTKELK